METKLPRLPEMFNTYGLTTYWYGIELFYARIYGGDEVFDLRNMNEQSEYLMVVLF